MDKSGQIDGAESTDPGKLTYTNLRHKKIIVTVFIMTILLFATLTIWDASYPYTPVMDDFTKEFQFGGGPGGGWPTFEFSEYPANTLITVNITITQGWEFDSFGMKGLFILFLEGISYDAPYYIEDEIRNLYTNEDGTLDLFNPGISVPYMDTLLGPEDSLTVTLSLKSRSYLLFLPMRSVSNLTLEGEYSIDPPSFLDQNMIGVSLVLIGYSVVVVLVIRRLNKIQ